jgi:hypothetical protein
VPTIFERDGRTLVAELIGIDTTIVVLRAAWLFGVDMLIVDCLIVFRVEMRGELLWEMVRRIAECQGHVS